MIKVFLIATSLIVSFTLFISSVSAHVVVKPGEVGLGAFQTFTIGVPVEKDIPTTSIRLVIPEGLNHVTPNVKQGWNIEVIEEGEGEEAVVKEIIWSGGEIPVGQRDEFLFSAQVPNNQTTLAWKAYQTYADGQIVAWDQSPNDEMSHGESMSPYSQTEVVDDLAQKTSMPQAASSNNNLSMIVSILALIVAITAVFMARKK